MELVIAGTALVVATLWGVARLAYVTGYRDGEQDGRTGAWEQIGHANSRPADTGHKRRSSD